MSEVIGHVTIKGHLHHIVNHGNGQVEIVGFAGDHKERVAVISRLKALLKG